jgi:hypothetical protein
LPNLYKSFKDYPSMLNAGNDDTGTDDELNNPYLSTQLGFISGFDNPNLIMFNSDGSLGNVFEKKSNWQEFTRLQIGSKWYNISDYFSWRFQHKFKKVNENDPNADGSPADATDINNDGDTIDIIWNDNGSDFGYDNSGY